MFDGVDIIGCADVLISGDRVMTVEPRDGRGVAGLALIPGLIDTHVHLVGDASDAGGDFYSWPLLTPPEEQVLHGLAHAQRALRAGVTTVRDLAADAAQVALGRAVTAGIVEGARVITHGMVGMTAGHYDLFTPATITQRPPTADGADACRALVRLHARNGLDGIKIATSGGVLSVGDRSEWRNHTGDEIAAIVDEAHALGMRVAAHAHTDESIRIALDHGVDSLEHATLMSGEQAERAAAAEVTVAPTLLINEAIAEGRVRVGEQAREKAAELVKRRDILLAAAARRGVRFVLGTDANGHHVRFGEQWRELVRMGEVLDLAPIDLLRAATSWAAEAVGQGGRLGLLRPGAVADAVLVAGRPWERIADLAPESIVAVIAGGRVVHGHLPSDVHG